MQQNEVVFKSVLHDHGYSDTKQRLAVFRQLVDQEPLSVHEVVERSLPFADRASVYRTIAIFEQLGIIQRINMGWKYKIELTDKFNEHHHHLTCVKCGKIIPINAQQLESFIEDVSLQNQFLPSSHQLEIQGLCDSCR